MIFLDQFFNHYARIVRQPSVIKRPRQMLSASAVANVQTHYVEAGPEGFVSRRNHVSRRGRALHTVPHQQRWMFRAILMPATAGQDLAARLYLKRALLIACPIARSKRPQISSKCLGITALENAMWNEVR